MTAKNLNYTLQNIDKITPKLTITSPKNEEKISNNSIQISLNTEDRESWIQKIECQKNSEAWEKCNNNHRLEIPQEWKYHIQARAIDIA